MVIVFTSKNKFKIKNIDGEIPIGSIDGINNIFVTNNKFSMKNNTQIKVYLNGVRQTIIEDYNVSESIINKGFDTITFVLAPKPNDNLLVDYIMDSKC